MGEWRVWQHWQEGRDTGAVWLRDVVAESSVLREPGPDNALVQGAVVQLRSEKADQGVLRDDGTERSMTWQD